MGVKDLMNLLKKQNCPMYSSASEPIQGDFWVDSPLIVMAALKKAEMENNDGLPIAKLSLKKTYNQLKAIQPNATIHWVFDGCSREEKKDTVHVRMKNNATYSKKCFENKIENLFEMEEDPLLITTAIVQQENLQKSLKEIYQEIKHFIVEYGPVYNAKHDSEQFIAQHMMEGDVAVTSDSDALPFGCTWIVQHFGSEKETWIFLHEILETLQLSMEKFIDLCILLGTDFNPRLKGCGPVKCFSEIQKADFSLEKFSTDNGGTDEWLQKAYGAKNVFLHV